MPKYAHLLVNESPSVSGLKQPRDRLLIALVRAHGQPRYDYPPTLVQHYKLDQVKTKKA
jgi:hypothetical protein